MKKKFKLEELDCAACAAKMEEAIRKIPGVQSASVNYLLQKLTIEAEEVQFARILDEAQRICAKVEPDCKIIRA